MMSLGLKSFYAQSLGISAPWKVTDVVFDGDHKVVAVFVECAPGSRESIPKLASVRRSRIGRTARGAT